MSEHCDGGLKITNIYFYFINCKQCIGCLNYYIKILYHLWKVLLLSYTHDWIGSDICKQRF